MATAFTHALIGASLVGTVPHPARVRVAIALAAVAVMPDADIIAFRWGIPYEHMLGHRGVTHSLPFAAALGILTFAVLRASGVRHARGLGPAVAAACGSHGVIDAFTDAGLGVGFWIPFSPARHFAPWRPLATSPIGVDAFVRGDWWAILANEARWVWLPWMTLCAAGAAVGSARRRRPPSAPV